MGRFSLLLMILFCSGCLSGGGGERISQGGQQNEELPGAPDFDQSLPPVNWYLEKMIPGNVTINANLKTVIYLRGRGVHNFLAAGGNHLGVYCLVASFEQANLKQQLRFRAVPLSLARGETQEKIFRVDISLAQEGSLACAGKVSVYDSHGTVLGEVDSNIHSHQIGYSPEELCSTCSGIQNASHLAMYRVSDNRIIEDSHQVRMDQLDLTSLGLRFDMENQRLPGKEGGGCSQGECRAKGFDCCLQDQCVLDGELRPGVLTSHPEDYAQAIKEGKKNDYPHLFFLCPLSRGEGEQGVKEEEIDSQVEERIRSERYRLDYLCLEAQDPAEGECSLPAHDTPALCQSNGGRWTYFCRVGDCTLNEQPSRPFCENAGGTWSEILPGDENGTEEAKIAVRKNVWERCGCKGSDCEGFGLKANKNPLGDVLSVECKFPEPVDEGLIQYLGVDLSTRSVPHRFFKASDGKSVDGLSDLDSLVPSERIPEGERFFYLAPAEQQIPQGNIFNMNAILGQFSTDVLGALPAKAFEVESGQVYIIRTRHGIYTPCPTCPPDSWQSNFLSYPPSKDGTGLQASGYIHSRTQLQKNVHRGNYEDTLFGRACWVPPTMIPFSHQKAGNISRQRSSRLKTQSALYVNGYRRDWFGFNLGAIIGSFDGVKWFAVGHSRRVIATSNKLFLAINAPFGDLAVPTNFSMDVVPDTGAGEVAPSDDYNTNVDPDHPEQNQGASCQYWHQCEVDSDCVSKLGWEYVCADINNYRSRWPLFDIDGNEKVNRETNPVGFLQILQNRLPVGVKKRCVYRGSGAVCKRDVSSDLSEKQTKLFQCAPNFYCASLRSNSFNDGIVRTPQGLDSYNYGQERDILGRPEHYVGAGEILDNHIVSNLEHNFAIHTNELSDVGICRPGKNLDPTDVTVQHSDKDNLERVDHINQISSCDSSAMGVLADNRIATCPIFQTEEEAAEAKGDYIRDRIDWDLGHKQNRCGGDIQRRDGSGGWESSFDELELDRLLSIGGIHQASLVKDACSRRAGAVCFTDLDCSPNILHSDLVDYLGESAFGNTRAEMLYWSEPLVCGQAQNPKPPKSEEYYKYDLGKNRCCRSIGKELTMFTQDDDEIIEESTDARILDVLFFPHLFEPANPEGFYSRYIVADPEQRSGAQGTPYPEAPLIEADQIPKSFQWKTFVDTGGATCCGGSWVRQFADGSNNWSDFNRLTIDPSHFGCLNYRSDIYRRKIGNAEARNYTKNSNKLCLSPGDSGCIQAPVPRATNFEIVPPIDGLIDNAGNPLLTATLKTTPDEVPGSGSNLVQTKSFAIPYMPIPYPTPTPVDPDGVGKGGPFNFFASPDYDAVSFYLPTYIGGEQNILRTPANELEVRIQYHDNDGVPLGTGPVLLTDVTITGAPACTNANNSNAQVLPASSFCITTDVLGYQVMHVRADPTTPANWEYAGIEIQFNVPGSAAFCYGDGVGLDPNCPSGETVGNGIDDDENPAGALNVNVDPRGMTAGNDRYYLTKLGRLELLGIPQIWYEPLYCNSNRHLLVAGIFDLSPGNRNAFEGGGNYDPFAFVYDDTVNDRRLDQIYHDPPRVQIDPSNAGGYVTYQDKISLSPVFSAHKFQCCLGLGEEALSASACCSGYAQAEGEEGAEKFCTLPSKTNLNVYFNRFVSNDGMGEEQPGGGLVDGDFIPETGEPKNEQEVYNKLKALGEAYCQKGEVRRGGAFGHYQAQPSDGYFVQFNTAPESQVIYSIVDDSNDWDDTNKNGYPTFVQGYRWNHHLYCQ